jgi:hypothetical protein
VQRSIKLLVVATAAMLLLGACGNPSSEARSAGGRTSSGNGSTGSASSGNGSTGSGDDPAVYEPPGNKPDGGVAGGGGKTLVVTPKGSRDPQASHWEDVEIIDDDTIRVFFWSGVGPCHVLDRVDVDYGNKKIGVTIYQGTGLNAADKPCIELAVRKAVEVDLDEPLNGRKIVDGVTRRFERP